jgi:glycosyltransferase involved in cell wall biosynthesis
MKWRKGFKMKNSDVLVSVIMPVYDVKEYLGDCLRSVLGQSYENLEIILVDDKSSDGGGKIADRFAKMDSRIRVIHKKKNEGLNMARKTGFDDSKGDLIIFVDSDDMVHVDYVRVLYDILIRERVDIAIVGHKDFSQTSDIAERDIKNIRYKTFHKDREVISGLLERFFGFPDVIPMTAWGKLYRREIIEKTDWDFANYRANEDNFEQLQWFSFAKNGVSVSDEKLYFYRQNPDGISRKKYRNIAPDGREINAFEFDDELYEKTREYLQDGYFSEKLVKYFYDAVMAHALLLSQQGLSESEAQSMVMDFSKIIQLTRDNVEIKSILSRKLTRPIRKINRIIKGGK